MTNNELIHALEELRDTLVAVGTGREAIQDVNDNYRRSYGRVSAELANRRVVNPIRYADLWDWWGQCRNGDLPTYASRRVFIGEIFNPLLNQIREGQSVSSEPTGWPRVDRNIDEVRSRLASAENEEQFQAVGLLCRETLISLAQAVFDPARHHAADGVSPSSTDAERMLEGFIACELQGGSDEEARRHAKSALKLAVALQHRRTAIFRDAALCAEATTSVINLIAIVSGRRDPN